MSSTSTGKFASNVAEHYNQVEQVSLRQRKHSEIIYLRKFNNAMKSLLHHQAFKFMKAISTQRELYRVLDLGCGKGGDLPKYFHNDNVELVVGVDIAEVSINQCLERYKSFRGKGALFKAHFFVADLTTVDIDSKLNDLELEEKFHIASCQFSLHYSFETYDKALRYLSNASRNIMNKGIFFGSYPDGPKLLKLARQSETPGIYKVGDLMSIQFSPEDMKNPRTFGTKYHFYLKESVDCPEFLVHPEVLERLLKKLGFHKIFDRSFEENLDELITSPADREITKKIIVKIDALDIDEESGEAYLDEESWKAASIYRCFCYRKIRDN